MKSATRDVASAAWASPEAVTNMDPGELIRNVTQGTAMRRLICTFLVFSLSACANEALTGPDAHRARPASASAAENSGPVILRFPGEQPGPRYYALFQRGFVPNDDGWVGIVFVRSPSCIPAGFNLLDWFDSPPRAWACALTVEGEAWWHDVLVPPPYQTHERGTGAVPVYFVRLSELQAAIADDVITIGELESLPSLLIGAATFLEHITHNTNQPTNHGHETLVSRGLLEDGRSFEFRYNEKFLPETDVHVFPNVKIEFK